MLALAVLAGGCNKSKSAGEGKPQPKFEVAEDEPAAGAQAVQPDALPPGVPDVSRPTVADSAAAGSRPEVPEREMPVAGGGPPPADSVPQPPPIAGGQLDAVTVPQGTPEELVQFLKQLADKALAVQLQIRQGTATPASLQPILEAMLEASNKVLAADVDEESRVSAVQAKAGALSVLSQLVPDRPWADQFREFATSLAADKSPVIAIEGRAILLGILVGDVAQGKSQDVDGLMTQLKALLADEHRNFSVLNVTQQAFLALRKIGREDEAHVAFELIANAFKDNPDAKLAAEADNMLEQLMVVDLKIDTKLNDVVSKREGAVAAFTDAITQLLQRPRPGLIVLQNVLRWLSILEQSGNYELAAKVCELTQAAYQSNINPEIQRAAQQSTEMMQRRLGLLGKPLSVEGTLLDGSPLDYAPYKGKVVLLAFWASEVSGMPTACRPELLVVKKVYEKYHAQGFEVIGVCLDKDMTAANRLLNDAQLPWTTITNTRLAEQSGIVMIPYLVLADQQGNVVELSVAAAALDAKLANLLGAANPTTPVPPVNQLREPASETK